MERHEYGCFIQAALQLRVIYSEIAPDVATSSGFTTFRPLAIGIDNGTIADFLVPPSQKVFWAR